MKIQRVVTRGQALGCRHVSGVGRFRAITVDARDRRIVPMRRERCARILGTRGVLFAIRVKRIS